MERESRGIDVRGVRCVLGYILKSWSTRVPRVGAGGRSSLGSKQDVDRCL